MSKQKLNLATVPGIQEIDDHAAEICSGGDFLVDLGDQETFYQGNGADINITNATQLGLENTNPGWQNPAERGHAFTVNYVDAHGTVIGQEGVVYGRGVLHFDAYRQQGAVRALVAQNIDPVSVNDPTCFC